MEVKVKQQDGEWVARAVEKKELKRATGKTEQEAIEALKKEYKKYGLILMLDKTKRV